MSDNEFVLIDEIEKAHEDLFELLLGILDKATLTLGNGGVVDEFPHPFLFVVIKNTRYGYFFVRGERFERKGSFRAGLSGSSSY